MQKHFYQQPLIEVITFPKTDIICSSNNDDILEWDKDFRGGRSSNGELFY